MSDTDGDLDQREGPEPDDPIPSGVTESDMVMAGLQQRKSGDGQVGHWMEVLIPDDKLQLSFLGDTQPATIAAIETLIHDIRRCGLTEEEEHELVGHPDDPMDGGLLGRVIWTQVEAQPSIQGHLLDITHETARALGGGGEGDGTHINIGPMPDDDEDN